MNFVFCFLGLFSEQLKTKQKPDGVTETEEECRACPSWKTSLLRFFFSSIFTNSHVHTLSQKGMENIFSIMKTQP